MRAQEAVRPFVNAAAGTSATFELRGGRYTIDFVGATGPGTVVLNRQNADGVTFSPVPITAITATSVSGPYDLPPGQYNVVIATLTANYVTICRVEAGE